jgi:hypothetical protein
MQVVGLLPMGDIKMPSANLQVEGFYMTFHKSNHAKNLQSGYKLRNKML